MKYLVLCLFIATSYAQEHNFSGHYLVSCDGKTHNGDYFDGTPIIEVKDFEDDKGIRNLEFKINKHRTLRINNKEARSKYDPKATSLPRSFEKTIGVSIKGIKGTFHTMNIKISRLAGNSANLYLTTKVSEDAWGSIKGEEKTQVCTMIKVDETYQLAIDALTRNSDRIESVDTVRENGKTSIRFNLLAPPKKVYCIDEHGCESKTRSK